MAALECDVCHGVGFQVTQHAWIDDGWDIIDSIPCRACQCHDCGDSAGEFEMVIRECQSVAVCVECAVMSGDDNEQSCRAHDVEAGR